MGDGRGMTHKEEVEYGRELDYNMSAKRIMQRRGKWTSEEENFAYRLVHEFRVGCIPLAEGVTLRSFLAKMLNCDPMRISKKFVGQNCIGKQVYKRRTIDQGYLPDDYLQNCRQDLTILERHFVNRVSVVTKSQRGRGGGFAEGECSYVFILPSFISIQLTSILSHLD